MTKRDFELIARVLAGERSRAITVGGAAPAVVNVVALRFSEVLKIENPRFDRERFLRACGYAKEGQT